jgi:hypothetical protein
MPLLVEHIPNSDLLPADQALHRAMTAQEVVLDEAGLDAELKKLAREICKLHGETLKNLLRGGELIHRAHELFCRKRTGRFQEWVKSQCGITYRTALNYRGAFLAFGTTKGETLSHFADASALYLLARDSSPQQARDAAIELMDSGEKVTLRVARELVEKFRPNASQPFHLASEIERAKRSIRTVFRRWPVEFRQAIRKTLSELLHEDKDKW